MLRAEVPAACAVITVLAITVMRPDIHRRGAFSPLQREAPPLRRAGVLSAPP